MPRRKLFGSFPAFRRGRTIGVSTPSSSWRASLEAAAASWVRRNIRTAKVAFEILLQQIGRKPAGKVRSRFYRDVRLNVAIDLVTGMDLWHLLTIVGTRDDGRRLFGPGSRVLPTPGSASAG